MGVISWLFDAYSLVVLVWVITSWIRLPPNHPVVRFTGALTEPVLAPIRRLLPASVGIDISPMVLLIALRLVKRLLLA